MLAEGRLGAARRLFHRAVALEPRLGDAWCFLGEIHHLEGNAAAADQAYANHLRMAAFHPGLMAAAEALCRNDLAVAERLLKGRLKQVPADIAALRMLAELAARLGRYADSEALLERTLELAPTFVEARRNHAFVLLQQNKPQEALAAAETVLAREPRDPGARNLKAGALAQIGRYEAAIDLYEALLEEFPAEPKAWLNYGHALKTEGRGEACVAAYRRSLALSPDFGEAYWSLANLKTFRFTPEEVSAMEAQLASGGLDEESRLHFHFALGKAYEDQGRDEAAFGHYAAGNRIRKAQLGYDAEDMRDRVERTIGVCSAEFFARRAGAGAAAADPIFIVGLPRSGSTLVEQILASHPAVEGTMELPDLPALAKRLGARTSRADRSLYPEILAELPVERLRELGEEYIERTRIQRRTGRPHFIDKLPNNFLHAGLIHLILPNARIIDARRHPMAACFSGFKQHFARGQAFSYGLEDIGRYYCDYARLMAHFDAVLPGRVHHVQYERMVGDVEGEIRRLLDYCGLSFDPACLRFHENDRSVRTASAEQVRTPIYQTGVDHWRRFEPWLGPLRDALGPVLESGSSA